MNERRKRILVVDDEVEILVLLSRRLQSWGYEVLTAATGEDALKMAEEKRPDLILLDIVMPEMGGRDVCLRFKSHPKTSHIPVVFLTALGMPEQVEAGIGVGANDYIVKPFEPRELRERIEACFEGVLGDDRKRIFVR